MLSVTELVPCKSTVSRGLYDVLVSLFLTSSASSS